MQAVPAHSKTKNNGQGPASTPPFTGGSTGYGRAGFSFHFPGFPLVFLRCRNFSFRLPLAFSCSLIVVSAGFPNFPFFLTLPLVFSKFSIGFPSFSIGFPCFFYSFVLIQKNYKPKYVRINLKMF